MSRPPTSVPVPCDETGSLCVARLALYAFVRELSRQTQEAVVVSGVVVNLHCQLAAGWRATGAGKCVGLCSVRYKTSPDPDWVGFGRSVVFGQEDVR